MSIAEIAERAGVSVRRIHARAKAWREHGKSPEEALALAEKSGPGAALGYKRGRKSPLLDAVREYGLSEHKLRTLAKRMPLASAIAELRAEKDPDHRKPESSDYVRNTGKAPTKPGEVYRGLERARVSATRRHKGKPQALDPNFVPAFVADPSLLPKRPPAKPRRPEPTETWDPAANVGPGGVS